MRTFPFAALLLPVFAASTAKADPPSEPKAPAPDDAPSGAGAFVAGAATTVVGMIVGGMILSAGNRSDSSNNVGWLTICGGFTLAPMAAHAVTGEWGRGLIFTAVPAAAMGGTGALFDAVPGTIDHGTLVQQRLMWALFGVGFLGAGVGVVDAGLAPSRARVGTDVVVAPIAGGGQVGLQIAGRL